MLKNDDFKILSYILEQESEPSFGNTQPDDKNQTQNGKEHSFLHKFSHIWGKERFL